MTVQPSKRTLEFGSGLSGNLDPVRAAEQVCQNAERDLGSGPVDLAVIFCANAHIQHATRIVEIIRARLDPTILIGASAGALIGGASELEDAPGVSLLAARMPGVQIHPFDQRDLLPFDDTTDRGLQRLGEGFGTADDLVACMIFVDPFSVPLVRLLPALNRARANTAPIFGAVASGATEPGGNALILNGTVSDRGLVGVSFRGSLDVDTVISQGCRPIGQNFVVTKARNNLILELGGRPALDVVQDTLSDLHDQTQDLLRKGGLLIGRVVDEYKERFGKDDYLIRNVVGAEESTGAIAWGDVIRVGQTVRMHVRDPQSAHDDLAMLLDAQKLHDRPAGALLFPCTSRGRSFFGRPHHDAAAVSRAFTPSPSAPELARGGQAIEPVGGPLPMAGFFAAGEIGPVGDDSYLHGHTACVALFREATGASADQM
ncbi:MAG: FIST C-terminal domain-containing protein [Planctomycetes bacterium]|nr:FIST C-terminal domain-containing protein [Planctomycetota bacterium]